MPELNFNLLSPSAELYSGPQVKLDPQAAYDTAQAQQQSNMLSQLYAKHYDPQTGGINYNSLIGEAAQNPLTARAIPKIMEGAQSQAQSMAEIEKNRAAAAKSELETKITYDENRHKEVNRAISDIAKYANKADAIAGIERNFEEGKLDQNAYDAVMGMVRAEPIWARSQGKILQSLMSEKEQLEISKPTTELGKLRLERQRALEAGDTEAVKLYDAASRIEAGQDVSAKDKANLNLDWAKYYWSQKQNSPEYKAQVAAAEAEGKDKVTFNAKLPSVISNATQAINLIDTMIGTPEVKDKEGKVVQKATAAHPGISAVGSIFNPLTTRISGTDAANFKAYLDQVQGGAFLDAYNTLRGGGAITQVEGQKATAAVTRMNLAQSKDEFIKAAREYQEVLRKGIENAKNKSGITTSGTTTSNW